MTDGAYTALLMALAAAISAIATFFKVETQRRSKLQSDLNEAFTKIRRLEQLISDGRGNATSEKTEAV